VWSVKQSDDSLLLQRSIISIVSQFVATSLSSHQSSFIIKITQWLCNIIVLETACHQITSSSMELWQCSSCRIPWLPSSPPIPEQLMVQSIIPPLQVVNPSVYLSVYLCLCISVSLQDYLYQ
jgi:hypothetical protein